VLDGLVDPLVDQPARLLEKLEGVVGPEPVEFDSPVECPFEDAEGGEREVSGLVAAFLNQRERAVCRKRGFTPDPEVRAPEGGPTGPTENVRRCCRGAVAALYLALAGK